MKFTRRAVAALATLVATSTLLAGCSSGDSGAASSAPPVPIDVGYIADYNGASLLAVADEQDLWAKHGLAATTKVFTNGPLQIDALGTGDLDFGYIGPGALWLPATGKAQIIAINTLGNADRVIAQPGITDLGSLRGKKIAVPEGTSGDMILTLALQKAGLTEDDVQILAMDAATIVPAFVSKEVDAAGFWYPAIGTIKQQVPDLVELAKNEDFSDEFTFPTAFVAGNDVVNNDPDTTEKAIAVLRDAIQYRSDHPQETIDATAAFLQLTPDQVASDAANSQILTLDELDADTKDGTITSWLAALNGFFVDGGKLTEPVDPSTYYRGDLFTGAGQ